MRRQNREVNIFNMSLLDILCGALGAFCFLMLSLLPDHIKAKQLQEQVDQMTPGGADAAERAEKAEREAEEAKKRAEEAEEKARTARAEQTLAFFQVSWNGPQDVDLWLKMPNQQWVLAKKAAVPKEQFYGEVADQKKGPTLEQAWLNDVAHAGDTFRLYAKLAATNGVAGPVPVTGYIAARVRRDEQRSKMTLQELPGELQREGEMVELGAVTFAADNYEIQIGQPELPKPVLPQTPPQGPPPAVPPASPRPGPR